MNDMHISIYEKIIDIFQYEFNVKVDDINTSLESELSSIDRISFLLKMEDEFNISYNFEKPLNTIQDVVDFIIDYKGSMI
jgi:acyl carrier protein